MALPPHLAFTSLGSGPRTVEFWVDFSCPFCLRITTTLENELVPRVLTGGEWHGQVRLLIRPFPQPWSPAGGWVAEAVLAYGRLFATPPSGEDPAVTETKKEERAKLWFEYYAELMKRQAEFKGEAIANSTVKEIKARAIGIAAEVAKRGLNTASQDEVLQKMDELLNPLPQHSTVVPDCKYFVRLGRQNGVHVTLSVLINGIFDAGPQSGWTIEQWSEWFAKQGVVAK